MKRLKAEGLWIRGVGIGAEEMVTINRLAAIIMEIAARKLSVRHIPGPLRVRGRKSDKNLIRERSNQALSQPLVQSLPRTCGCIPAQFKRLGFCPGLEPAVQTATAGRS